MKYKKGTALFLVALVAFVYLIAPVAANDSGTISGTFKSSTPPTVLSITPNTGSANPTPDDSTPYAVTVQVRDSDGYADIHVVDASLHEMQDSLIEIDYAQELNSGTGFRVVDAYTIDVTFVLDFQYWTPPGQYAITATATDTAGGTGTLTSGAITYASAIGLTLDGPTTLDFGTLTYSSQSASKTSTIHNSANTAVFVRGTAPDWVSSAGGSAVPASTLTADGIAMNSGTSIVQLSTGGPGAGAGWKQTLSFVETVPSQASGFTLAGTYTTTITLTARSS